MNYFKYMPSCSICEYATEYIPYYTFPYSDPFCSKGHGQCKVDKVCHDFRKINTYFCHECDFFNRSYCYKRRRDVHDNEESCTYFIRKGEGDNVE